MTEGGEIEALVRSFAPPGLQATWTFCGAVMPTTPPSGIAGSPRLGRAHSARDGPCQNHGVVLGAPRHRLALTPPTTPPLASSALPSRRHQEVIHAAIDWAEKNWDRRDFAYSGRVYPRAA